MQLGIRHYIPRPAQGAIPDGRTRSTVVEAMHQLAECTLVQRSSAWRRTRAAPTPARVLTVLYDVARLFAGRTLSPADVAATYREMSETLTGLLG